MDFFIRNDKTDEILAELEDAEGVALDAIGLKAAGDVRLKAPVDTGLLKNSITHAIGGMMPELSEYKADSADKNGEYKTGSYEGTAEKRATPTVYIGTNVEYAIYVEEGTSLTDANPFLKPTIEANKEKYRKIGQAEIEKRLSEIL